MPKEILLTRHGHYDVENLSALGKQQVDAVAEQLAKDGKVPDIILHSPVPRAAESARRMKDAFNRVAGKDVPLVMEPSLSDEEAFTSARIFQGLSDDASRVLAVTHQPNIIGLATQFRLHAKPAAHAETTLFTSTEDLWAEIKKARFTKTFRP